jgi:serine/threonine-protein kinase RsbW
MALETEVLIEQAAITVDTDLNEISRIAEWYEQFNRHPLSQDLWLEGQIALIEGFTNAVRHAHRHLKHTTPIEINGQFSQAFFQLCIWDCGSPFDFESNLATHSQIISSPDFDPYTREAHWGSIIMLKLRTQCGWQISYQHLQNLRNCLCLVKTL